MTTLELVLGGLVPLVGGSSALAVWLRSRGSLAVAQERGAQGVVKPLTERLDKQDRRIDTLRDELDAERQRVDECERKHADCERTTTSQAERIGDLESRLARRDADVTQRIEVAVDRHVRRTTTPPHDTPAQPVHRGPHSARVQIPPPKRGKET